jgi:TonB family protein
MGSSQNSAAHLENMRHRRINRMKRQRAIEIGKPVDVSLKPMALNSGQKKELSGLQLHAHDHQKHQGAKRSRASVLASLGLHAIAVFIAAFYVVRTAQVNDEAVSIDFFQEILEKRDPPKRKDVVKQKALPTEPLKPIVLPVPKVPVRPITSDSEGSLGDPTMGGFVDSGPVVDANIKIGGIIDNVGPIKRPTVDTGDPTEGFRPTFDDDGLGDIGEPPDLENTPDADLTGGDAFKPQEILKRPSWRRQADPKYPSEAKRAGKEGKVVLEATIGVDGKATDIEVKEDKVGFGCARAAIQALKSSRFNPAKRGDDIVPMRIAIPYEFKLEE